MAWRLTNVSAVIFHTGTSATRGTPRATMGPLNAGGASMSDTVDPLTANWLAMKSVRK